MVRKLYLLTCDPAPCSLNLPISEAKPDTLGAGAATLLDQKFLLGSIGNRN